MRLAVLISGSGRTLENFLRLGFDVALVVASRDCPGCQFARDYAVPLLIGTNPDDIFAACRDRRVGLVCLAGWLKLLKVPADFANRVLNIHPALLPAFGGKGMYGRHVHEAVLSHGVKLTGCTVHVVDEEYDHGPIVLQRAVPVLDQDSPRDVAARVFAEELIAYPEAVLMYPSLEVVGRKVRGKE